MGVSVSERGRRSVRALRTHPLATLLVLVSVALAVCAGWNFKQQSQFRLPEDGVIWLDRPTTQGRVVVARHVSPESPAARAGIRSGDRLLAIDQQPVSTAGDVARILFHTGAWNKAVYQLQRDGIRFEVNVYLTERPPQASTYFQYLIALAYLLGGLIVLLRRPNYGPALHYYALSLLSFVLFGFHYTGSLSAFDAFVYWGNVIAGLFAPSTFVHFALVFPERPRWMANWANRVVLYAPAGLLLGLHWMIASGHLRVAALSLVEVRWWLDRVWIGFLLLGYLAGAAIVHHRLRNVTDLITRHQLKWLRNGVLFGIVPFSLGYGIPYLLGQVPGTVMSLAVTTLLCVPVCWGYAVVRYRLMDADIALQQGSAYALASLAVLGILYGLLFSVGRFEELSTTALLLLSLVAALVFQPIRRWIRELLERHYFYRDHYDYRQTLEDFARDLGAEISLERMLEAAADRLGRALNCPAVAFFLRDERDGDFYLHYAQGLEVPRDASLDLSFLTDDPNEPYLIIETTGQAVSTGRRGYVSPTQASVTTLGLVHYVPCKVRGRVIAYVGLSRTHRGDFLTSDDLKLVSTVCGYLAIAIENARLYRSLEAKIEQYERLKEFSENIVESINVGIVAASLDDRIESWNAQMELLTGIPREAALGRRLDEVFPSNLMAEVEQSKSSSGIHHVYKYTLDPAQLPAELRAQGWQALRDRASGTAGGVAVQRPSIVNVAIAPLVSKNLDEIGRLIIFDDITERAELERKLVEADKLSSIGLLAAGVAHEVNTPLAVISTYAQMLARQLSGDEQKSRLLEKIAQQTFRASEIVNSLLNFSRTAPTEFTEVDLNVVVRETLSLIEHQLTKQNIRIELQLEEPLPRIRGNASKLQQVFLNLFLNARDAMEAGGVLRVRTWSTEESVIAQVADTGKGIPPEILSRIYDPFFTTKGPRKGTGLGLSVTYGIVREHGGTIEVESLPGAGTCFHLDFPKAKKPVGA